MTVLGAVSLPQLPPERLRDVAQVADETGLEELWLWEDCFWTSGVATAAAVLAQTRRLRVGVGVLPVPLRNVALAAMEVATLQRLFPDRLTVGVSHGVQDWMGQVGARVGSPMTLLREYTTALRALLRGEQVTVDGRYVRLAAVALDWPPASPPPVLVGATGPRTLRLAGEVGDGVILTDRTTPDGVRLANRLAGEGRADAEAPGGLLQTVVYLLAATGPDAADRLAAEQRRQSDEPVYDAGVAGDAHAVAAAVRRWADAGATTVVLQPTLDEPDPAGFIRFVAQEVRPLVP